MTHQSIKELKKIAKERKVTLKTNATNAEIRVMLGLEPKPIPSRYDHCKKRKQPQVVVKIDVNTGEETKYNSMYELACSLNLFAGSIAHRIRAGSTMRNSEGQFKFRKVEC